MSLLDAMRRAREEKERLEKGLSPASAPSSPTPCPPAPPSPAPGPEEAATVFDEAGIQKIIDRIDEIPTLPVIATRVLDQINNPMSDARTIAEVIKNDQSLTAKVLKMSNSAFYKGYSDITSIQTAIARLGIMTIKRMVFTVSVFDTFSDYEELGFTLQEFWHHSIAVAVAARLIGEKTGVEDLEDLFTAGILHDIGKLIMVQHVKVMFGEVLDYLEDHPELSFYQAEKEKFPFTHCQVGSWLAVKWNLARRIQNVIFGHHEPNLDTNTFTREVLIFPAIVHIANNLAKQCGHGHSGGTVTDLDERVVEFVLGRRTTLAAIHEAYEKEGAKIEAFLGGMK